MDNSQDLKVLEKAMLEADAAGDVDKATFYARAYAEAKRPGTLETLGKAVVRGGGNVVSGAKDMATFMGAEPLSEEKIQKRKKISEQERIAEAKFGPYKEAHPLAAFIGKATVPTLMSGGRSPLTSLLRGAGTGMLMHTDDQKMKSIQSVAGGGLGLLGQKMGQGSKELGRRASKLGLESMPEEKGVTFIQKDALSDLAKYRVDSFKVAKQRQKAITKQALIDIGEIGDKLSDDVLLNAKDRSKSFFDSALSSKENLVLTKKDSQYLNSFINANKTKATRSKAARRHAIEIMNILEKNGGIIPVKEYQAIRSNLTDEIVSTTKPKNKKALGDLVGWLDDSAESNLSGPTLRDLKKGRDIWKKYVLLKNSNAFNPETGLINPKRLDSILRRKDSSYLTRTPSKLHDMLRVNRQLAGSSDVTTSPRNTLPNLRIGMSGGGRPGLSYYSQRLVQEPLESIGMAANRLPMDLMTDFPPGGGMTILNAPELNLKSLLEYQKENKGQ